MKPLVERYLASLPALHRKESGTRHRHPSARRRGREAGREGPRAEEPGGRRLHRAVREQRGARLIAARAWPTRSSGNLQRVLREELGGTYGVSVEPGFAKLPRRGVPRRDHVRLRPARTDELVKAACSGDRGIQGERARRGQIADARAALLRDLETNSRENGYLLSRLAYAYEYGEAVESVFNLKPTVDRLTASMIRDAARTYLDTRRYVEVTLLPEVRKP